MIEARRPIKSFYRARTLQSPAREFAPESTTELRELFEELPREVDPSTLRLLGDGQHIEDLTSEQTVIRTSALNRVLEIDRHSGLIRAEAGITWRALGEALEADEFSLQTYGLHPATATLGGLLARRRPGPPLLRGGDLLDGCVAITAMDPLVGDYRYLTAPRKASGPDLRYRFLGASGAHGPIFDATFVVARPQDQALILIHGCSLPAAAALMRQLFRAGLFPALLHYSQKRKLLQFILTAPSTLLAARISWIQDTLFSSLPGHLELETGDRDDAQKRRLWLEARHPHRRSAAHASRNALYWFSNSALLDDAPLFDDSLSVQELEITTWTPQYAQTFLHFDLPAPLEEPPAPKNPAQCWAQELLHRSPKVS